MASTQGQLPRQGATEEPKASSPQLLQRAFMMLSLFTPEKQEWTLSEVGHSCNLPSPTVHRILTALQREGYLSRNEETKRFRLGPALLSMGRTAARSSDLHTLAVPVLEGLVARTNQTALLTALTEDSRSGVCVARAQSHEALRVSVSPGRTLPLHAGACGKILLAHLSPSERAQYLAGLLEPVCSGTITSPSMLGQELSQIKQRGWASSHDETSAGVSELSVALLDHLKRPVASLTIASPTDCRPPDTRQWLLALMDSALRLAQPLSLHSTLRPARLVTTPGGQ